MKRRKQHLVCIAVALFALSACQGGSHSFVPPPSPRSVQATATPASYENIVLADTPSQYFTLSESSGPTAVDSSPTHVNGTYIGAITYGASGPLLNESSKAIALPGGTHSVGVSLPNPNAIIGASYSVETWVYPNASSSFMTIWGYSGARRLLLTPQHQLLTQYYGNFYSKGTLSTGHWHDVVLVYNAPAATMSFYIDGKFDNSMPLANKYVAFTSSYYVGQYDTGLYYKWNGKLAQHAFFKTALTANQVAQLYSAAGYGAAPSPTPSPNPTATPAPTSTPIATPTPAFTDWNTFGDTLQRTNYNPNETALSAANASKLKLAWRTNLGSAITAQPIVATNITINGVPTTVVYIGTEGGVFYALNATTGATIWSQALGTVTTGCMQLPHGVMGITGTATYDKSLNRIYVADGKDQLHALDMSTGAEASGWPMTIESSFTTNHIYSALSLNPDNGLLYVETASLCDAPTWHGRIDAVNPSGPSIVASFYPGAQFNGAGIWGSGGASIDQSTDNVYIATGNDASGESGAYGDHVVRLSSTLALLGSDFPNITGSDEDFGATPMLYRPDGCPELFVVKNKSGFLYTYDATLASGALQSLAMAPVTATGQFVGTTAYSPSQNLVYVGDPRGNSTFTHGLIALAPQPDCSLNLVWQQTTGPANYTGNDNNEATVANGVVYFTDGVGNQAFAFDAASGAQLWNSGSTIGGPVMLAPTVDGELYVSSWDGYLYAFAP